MNNTNRSSFDNQDLVENCLHYCRENVLRPETAAGYLRIIRIFIRDTGTSRVSEITPDLLTEWRESVIRRCTTTTFNTYLRHLRAILNFCLRKKIIVENPLLGIKQFRRATRRRKACSQEDVNRLCQYLLAECDLPWSRFALNAVLTLYYSGIRRSQLCGLEWRDIDFNERTIFLHSEHSKTGASWSIPLHDDLHAVLLEMKREASQCFPGFRDSDQVFLIQRYSPLHRGQRMSPGQLSKIIQKSANRCCVDVCAHKIRHLFATIIANQEAQEAGGDVPLTLTALRDILGHRSITTTVGYIEPSLSSQREVIRGIRGLAVVQNLARAAA